MPRSIPYSKACSNFEEVYQEVQSTQEVIAITREGFESVSLIPTEELESLMETVYLLQSPKNAVRLSEAIKRASERVNQPRTVEELRVQYGLESE